ncbi:hypothetical protein BP6252_06426 [Coleophoma cylindrospora]|uniref:Uncharacterized protein n=1 Tax=Coleophoma cylindrospora TaxID=1849047 RepID=A0A3D8RN04_9HELO|nr:hypothetical protein BP6252_06426 [Coleophoma cylindrospora]
MSASVNFPAVNTLRNLTDKERKVYKTKYNWWSKTLRIYRRVHPHSLLDQPRGRQWNAVLQAGLQETPPFYKCTVWRGSLQPIATRHKTDLWTLKALNDSRTSAPLPQPKPAPAPKQKQKSTANASANRSKIAATSEPPAKNNTSSGVRNSTAANGSKKAATSKPPAKTNTSSGMKNSTAANGPKKAATSKPPGKNNTSSGVKKGPAANGSKKAVASKSPTQSKMFSGVKKRTVATASTFSSLRMETRATTAAKRSMRAASIQIMEPSPSPYSYTGPYSQFTDSESDTVSQGTVEEYHSRPVRSDAPEPDVAQRASPVQDKRPVCYEEAAAAMILISLRHGHNLNYCSDKLAACQDFQRQFLEAYRWSPEAHN